MGSALGVRPAAGPEPADGEAFGEIEFWSAMIKIVLSSRWLVRAPRWPVVQHCGPRCQPCQPVPIGALFPHGGCGLFAGFQIAVFSLCG